MAVDSVVRRETIYIGLWSALLSILMEAVFLLVGKWDYTVLTGNLLGGGIAVLNFFLMGLTVQKAVGKEEKEIKRMVAASQNLRTVMLFTVIGVGIAAPCFSTVSTLIPLFFPRIALLFRPLFLKKEGEDAPSDKGGEN